MPNVKLNSLPEDFPISSFAPAHRTDETEVFFLTYLEYAKLRIKNKL